jgi:hypothetical protein
MEGQKLEQRTNAERVRLEAVLVRRWRRDQFCELGFPLCDARRLAQSEADLARTRKLIADGCTHKLAFRIVF